MSWSEIYKAVNNNINIPLNVYIEQLYKAQSLNDGIFANKEVFLTDGTFIAPKKGLYFISLIGNGGKGGNGGRGGVNPATSGSKGTGGNGGQGGQGGSGYFLFRLPFYMDKDTSETYTTQGISSFGSLTAENGGEGNPGGAGGNASGINGGRGGDGGQGGDGGIPGIGGTGGKGGQAGTSGTAGANGTGGWFLPSQYPVCITRFPVSGTVLPASYIFQSVPKIFFTDSGRLIAGYGGAGGGGVAGTTYPTNITAPGEGKEGNPGAVIIEWN